MLVQGALFGKNLLDRTEINAEAGSDEHDLRAQTPRIFYAVICAPRTTLPGIAPVGLPSSNVISPLTKVYL